MLCSMFDQDIFACDAKVSGAIFHISWNIRCANNNQTQIRIAGADNEFARLFRIFAHGDAGCLKQG